MALHYKIIIGLILGILWAFISSVVGLNNFTSLWIDPLGDIFMKLLKLLAIPLVLFSIIKGVYDLSDMRKVGKIGLKTIGIFLLTTTCAVSIGMFLANSIAPGEFIAKEQRLENRKNYEQWAHKNNIALKGKALFSQAQFNHKELAISKKIEDKIESAQKNKQKPLDFLVRMVPDNFFKALADSQILSVIVFAILFGIALMSIDPSLAKPIVEFTDGLNAVFIALIELVMHYAPFFVFCLMAGKLSAIAGDDPGAMLQVFSSLAVYSLTVLLGLLVMVFVVYPVLLKIFVKKSRIKTFFKHASPAQLLAFSTSSSAATLPVTMDCVHDNMKVPKDITSFVLPIGATINMDGTSLYQAIAAIFLAQFHFIDLSLFEQITIISTALLASIGTAAVPSAGIVMLVLVLESVGLNPAWIALVLPVDRILDMCRTVVNVTGDMTVCSVVDALEKK